MRVFVSSRGRASAVRWTLGLGIVLVGGYAAVRAYAPFLADPAALRAWVDGFGPWAPVAFVALQAAQVVVAPIPGQATGLLAGFLFGALWGSVYSLVGVAAGSTLVFWLSRRYGRAYVQRVIAPAVLARFDSITRRNASLGLLVAFVVPGLPDDVLCFVGGLTDLPLRRLVAISVVGRAPSIVLVVFLGAELGEGNLLVAATLGALLVAATVAGYLNRGRIVRALGG